MINVSLDRNSNNQKALYPNAVAEIRNLNVNGAQINFELFFFADEEARNLLNVSNPTNNHMPTMGGIDGGTIMRKSFSEKLSTIEAYEPEDSTVSPSEQLKSCCYQWLVEKHYPQA